MSKNNNLVVGFPSLNQASDFDATTRPLPLSDIPKRARIDSQMEIIERHHERIAKAIHLFWGHRDCVEYLQKLILSGGDGLGKTRVGFKREVLSALITLVELHERH